MNFSLIAGGGMSHSPVIGQDVQTASNGVDASEPSKAPDWSGPHGFTHQGLKFMDEADFHDTHKGTRVLSETLKQTPCHMDSVCKETLTFQSHTDLSETAPIDESPNLTCTQSSETELTHARSKRELEEWRGGEEERKEGDGEVNINKREMKQRKEMCISVQVNVTLNVCLTVFLCLELKCLTCVLVLYF